MVRVLMNEYGYSNRNLLDCLSVDNKFHSELYRKAQNKMVILDAMSNIDSIRSHPLNGKASKWGCFMDEAVAKVSQVELRGKGLSLNSDCYKNKTQSLIASYLLNSSLIYVEVSQKKGMKKHFFATKNVEVVKAIFQHLNERSKGIAVKLNELDFETNHSEVNTGTYDVITFTPELRGFQIGKRKLNTLSKMTTLLPMYQVGLINDNLVNLLSRQKTLITFKDEYGEIKKVKTSLNHDLLKKWLGTSNDSDVLRAMDSVQDNYVLSNICVPDLARKHSYVTVPILSILKITSSK